jgi:PPOX class probable F420-dependent enzyme
MTTPTDLAARERYVALVTFRKNGDQVATPVWIAPLGDGTLGVITDPEAGKVKRLRNDARVTLQPCDMRGRIAAGAPTWTGSGHVVDGEPATAVERAVGRKYGWQYRLIGLGSALKKLVKRGAPAPERAIVITLDS